MNNGPWPQPMIRIQVINTGFNSAGTTSTGTTSTGNVFFGGNWSFSSPRRPPDDGLAGAYAVLGVPPKSPPDVIRKAYRDKLFETHPDHGGSDKEVRQVIEAYKRLVG